MLKYVKFIGCPKSNNYHHQILSLLEYSQILRMRKVHQFPAINWNKLFKYHVKTGFDTFYIIIYPLHAVLL